jgi:4-hydroxy-tetrahydrodipicolinate synthase
MQAGIEAHFRAVAGSTCLPIILHDIPSRTLRELSDDTLGRLAESRQFVGLRDGSGDIARIMRLERLLRAGFRLLSGDDTSALAFVACGGSGSISIVSNVMPDQCRMIFSNCRQGRLQCARYLQGRIVRLAAELSRENPASLKYALSLLGLMRPHTRLPITGLDAQAKDRIANVMAGIADEDLADAEEA